MYHFLSQWISFEAKAYRPNQKSLPLISPVIELGERTADCANFVAH